jgi:hypothetical protein
MKNFFLWLVGMCMSTLQFAQFVNNGATVTIQPGATLRVETSFLNNTGTVTNNGTLEVQDSFKNSATFFSGTSSIVRFIGSGISNVKSNGATLRNIEMSKTNNNIKLLDPLTISKDITFVNDNNKVLLENHNFKINDGGSVLSSDNNEYFVAVGSGKLVKGISSNGTHTLEVGDAINYTPISNNISGGSYSNATIEANVVNAVHPDKPSSITPYLTRYWNVGLTGVTGQTSALTATYNEADDVSGTPESALNGAVYPASNIWSFMSGSSNTTNNTVSASTTENTFAYTGMSPFSTFDVTAFVEGYMDGTNPTMRPVLLNSGIGTSTTNCDNITIELRNTTTPYALAHTFTGIITTNGVIRCAFPGNVTGSYYVALRHRNALETWSKTPITFSNGGNYDFSTGVAQAYGDNMVNINGKWCMFSGDINSGPQDGNIDFIDYPVWETDANNFESGYFSSDLNGDGVVDFLDYPLWETNNNNFVSVMKP